MTDESVDVPSKPDSEDSATDHLTDLPDGAGCTEIWEHLSRQRATGEDEESGGAEGAVGDGDGGGDDR